MAYTVRKALPQDAAALCALNTAFNGVGCTPGQVRAALERERGEIVRVAAREGAIVGFACGQVYHSFCYGDDAPVGEITELYVDPAHRRSGVGQALIKAVEEAMAVGGVKEVRLETGADNLAAQALYAACGYACKGSVCLEKTLDGMA